MKVDWQAYKEDFPSRYISQGFFDSVVEYIIKSRNINLAVDIGGGAGTQALKNNNTKVFLLDRYVTKPDWMHGEVTWDSAPDNYTFDLAVARGSINYLSRDEITSVPDFANRFIFNTFVNPPSETWTARNYENGIELFRYIKSGKYIDHKLITKNNKIIDHRFYYYMEEDYKKFLPGVKIIKYSKNSMLLNWEKNET